MLPIKFIRENTDAVKNALTAKNTNVDLDNILHLDTKRREIIQKADVLKSKRNTVSDKIAEKKKLGETAEIEISEMKEVSTSIKSLDSELNIVNKELDSLLLYIPNVYHDSVPVGTDPNENVVVRKWSDKPDSGFKLKDHLEICDTHNLLDFTRGAKMSGSGFPLYTGLGAKLERALINFMLDFHLEKHDYSELMPPFLTTRSATTTTGQLPKLEEDMYYIPVDELFCIPTAEVPVTNIHKDEILSESDLPKKYVAYSACFRREAGSYGKDTRGLLRVHQFNKVELVKFVKPEDSYRELETLTADAEKILQVLGLHYRVVELCSGDLSFAAAKCYDIEVWAPGEQKYLEVSSCSNFEDFQARRGNIRYRSNNDRKVRFIHTLNGSGVATPRLMVALLETYQQKDGSILIPEPLQKYMGMTKISQ